MRLPVNSSDSVPPNLLTKESFHYPETRPVFDLIEQASRRSGVSRGQAFEDFLHMSVCALSGGQMEAQYLATVQKHTEGKPGRRGCDSLAAAFGTLIAAMEETRKDILGDLFEGAITYGENGQFMTSEPVASLLASFSIQDRQEPVHDEQSSDLQPNGILDHRRQSAYDPCCGSGRMLLAIAGRQPHWEFIGQDIDLRCVRMTTLNLALRNLYGYVIWGDTLANERRLVYRTGFNLRCVVQEIPLEDCPAPVRAAVSQPPPCNMPPTPAEMAFPNRDHTPAPPGKQQHLF